jgi:hypothetical protein
MPLKQVQSPSQQEIAPRPPTAAEQSSPVAKQVSNRHMHSGRPTGEPHPQTPEAHWSLLSHAPPTPSVPPQFPVAGSQVTPHPQLKHWLEPVKVVKVPA